MKAFRWLRDRFTTWRGHDTMSVTWLTPPGRSMFLFLEGLDDGWVTVDGADTWPEGQQRATLEVIDLDARLAQIQAISAGRPLGWRIHGDGGPDNPAVTVSKITARIVKGRRSREGVVALTLELASPWLKGGSGGGGS